MLSQDFAHFDNFFFDLDGVIWEGEELLPGASELLSTLRHIGKNVYFISNNTSRTREDFTEKFRELGVETNPEMFLSAPYSMACYLQGKYPPGTKVFVLGQHGVVKEIRAVGLDAINCYGMREAVIHTAEDFQNLQIDPEIKIVAVGITTLVNYYMLCYASKCIQLNNALLIGGNIDKYDKLGDYSVASTGVITTALEICTGAESISVGKPHTFSLDFVNRRDRLDSSKSVIFGDKMNTDILLGKEAGIKTALLLTGVETRESASGYDYSPDLILESLTQVLGSHI